MNARAIRGALRPGHLLGQVLISSLVMCSMASLLRWFAVRLVQGAAYDWDSGFKYGPLLVAPLGSGLVISMTLRGLLRHPAAGTLPGLEKRLRQWHAIVAALVALAFGAIDHWIARLGTPFLASSTVAFGALTVTLPMASGRQRRAVDWTFRGVSGFLLLAGGCASVEFAAALRDHPGWFAALGLGLAAAGLAVGYRRVRLMEDIAARTWLTNIPPATEAKPARPLLDPRTPSTWEWMDSAWPGIGFVGGFGYGVYSASQRSWILNPEMGRYAEIAASFPLTMLATLVLTPRAAQVLVRNDYTPTSRARRLANARRVHWLRLIVIAATGVASAVGFEVGSGRFTLPLVAWDIALNLQVLALSLSLYLALTLMLYRLRPRSGVSSLNLVASLVGLVPAGLPLWLHSLHRWSDPDVSAATLGCTLAAAALLQWAIRAQMRAFYLRGDLLAREA